MVVRTLFRGSGCVGELHTLQFGVNRVWFPGVMIMFKEAY
jgi:hypothetical protein